MGSIVRGKIIRDDLALWDGKTATATRPDATSGTVSGLQLNDFVDVLQIYGSGTARTVGTIDSAISTIGSSVTCTLMFAPGTWTIDSDLTIGSNFTVYAAAGAVFSVSSGKTLTLSGPVIREALTWTGGTGTVTVSKGGADLIDIEDAGGYFTGTTVEDALQDLGSTANGKGASIIGLEDSGANYAAADVEAAFAELASTASGEGASIIGVEDSAGNFTGTDVEAVLAELQSNVLGIDVIKYKTADKTLTSNTTVEDDDHLAGWSLDADSYYLIEGYLAYSFSVGDIQLYIQTTNVPQASSIGFIAVDQSNNIEVYSSDSASSPGTSITTLADGVDAEIRISGFIRSNASTGGTLDLQWAQATSSVNDTTVHLGSWIRLRKIS